MSSEPSEEPSSRTYTTKLFRVCATKLSKNFARNREPLYVARRTAIFAWLVISSSSAHPRCPPPTTPTVQLDPIEWVRSTLRAGVSLRAFGHVQRQDATPYRAWRICSLGCYEKNNEEDRRDQDRI